VGRVRAGHRQPGPPEGALAPRLRPHDPPDERHLRALRGLLARTTTLTTIPTDYDEAAFLYRSCGRRGGTVRRLVDCLIAAQAIRADLPILHADADFTTLAAHTSLRVTT
jgi:predicted nucleic acid-binding protein